MKNLSLLICINIFGILYAQYGFPDHFQKDYFTYENVKVGVDCMDSRIIFKINPEYRYLCSTNDIDHKVLKGILEQNKLVSLKKLYPNHEEPKTKYNSIGKPNVDLSLIYEAEIAPSTKLISIINNLNHLDIIAYAQPRIIDQPMFLPNDPQVGIQWAITKMKLDSAWNVDTGDVNVVIGIVDGGTNFTHEDLQANVRYSSTDPVNGLDDDNDGFIDNYRGWDVGDWDNDPQYIGAFNSAHGTAMCGLAAASPNNAVGMVGSSYRCSYLPVKMVHSSFGWIAGYEGIVYAADHGSHVISNSWGSTVPGPYGQDIVNYATNNRNCLVLAAAGNSNNTIPFYPCAYDNVIGVGGTQSNDTKSPGSSYYEMVDIATPGQAVYLTYATGYGLGYGTSDATALTSGVAGLIQSRFDTYTPLQVGALLRQSTYRIDTIPGNASFINKQGSGRTDAWRAFTMVQKPYIEFAAREFTDGNDNVLLVDDTVSISGNMINFLTNSTSGLKALIIDNSPYIQWIDSNVTLGVINTLNFVNTTSNPFRFRIIGTPPTNMEVLLRVKFVDGSDTLNTQYFSIVINRDYYNIKVNNLRTTATKHGRIGFTDNMGNVGTGYRYKGDENLLFSQVWNPFTLMIGTSSTQVSDATVTSPTGGCCPFLNDYDFRPLENLKINHNPPTGNIEIKSVYDDGFASLPIGIKVKEKIIGFNSAADSNYLFVEYQFENTSGTNLSTWYAGLFTDCDVTDSLVLSQANNIARYDTISQMGMMYNQRERYYVGVKVLSPLNINYYANHSGGDNGGVNIYNGFTTAEKFSIMNASLTSNATVVSDVSQYIGVEMDTMIAGGCAMVHFAIVIGRDLNEIRTSATAAQTMYTNTYNFWLGTTSTDWHTASNWSQGSVPDATDHVIVNDVRSTTNNSPMITGANGVCNNIEIRCGGKLDVASGFRLVVGN